MKCTIDKCPNGLHVCCQTCEAKEFCDKKCETVKPCMFQSKGVKQDVEERLQKHKRKLEKKLKQAETICVVTLIITVLIFAYIADQLNEVKKMQTDTLNTLMDTERQIDDLSKENAQVEQVYQNDEKVATRGEYERTSTCLGEFTITYYCGCEKCCGKTDKITKLGTVAEAGRTVGADWNVLQPGTKIYIEGIGERVVEDTGGGIQGNHIDVYVDSHQEAINLGKTTRKVYEVM